MKHVGIVSHIALLLCASTADLTTCIKAIIEVDMSEQRQGKMHLSLTLPEGK